MIHTNKEIHPDQNRVNQIFQEVIRDIRRLGIPVSKKIQQHIVINKRARTRFGCCKRLKTGLFGSEFVIEVSEILLYAPEASLKQTLAHEALHTCPGCGNHSGIWKAYAEQVNKAYGYRIQRVSDPTAMGVSTAEIIQRRKKINHVLICENCGARIERTRASKVTKYPQLYRCRCGGRLIRVKSNGSSAG